MTGELNETIETAPDVAVAEESMPVDVNDVDASWDGKGSLDTHRQAAFEKLKQPGFGREGVKSDDK